MCLGIHDSLSQLRASYSFYDWSSSPTLCEALSFK
jgi:hypothetical protein